MEKDALLEVETQYENAKVAYFQAIETLKAKNAFEKLTKIRTTELSGNLLNYVDIKKATEIG